MKIKEKIKELRKGIRKYKYFLVALACLCVLLTEVNSSNAEVNLQAETDTNYYNYAQDIYESNSTLINEYGGEVNNYIYELDDTKNVTRDSEDHFKTQSEYNTQYVANQFYFENIRDNERYIANFSEDNTTGAYDYHIYNGTELDAGDLDKINGNNLTIESEPFITEYGYFNDTFDMNNYSKSNVDDFPDLSGEFYINASFGNPVHRVIANTSVDGGQVQMTNSSKFDTEGGAEAWFYTPETIDSGSVYHAMLVRSSSYPHARCNIQLRDGIWKKVDGGNLNSLGFEDPQPSTWYHIQLDWSNTEGHYDVRLESKYGIETYNDIDIRNGLISNFQYIVISNMGYVDGFGVFPNTYPPFEKGDSLVNNSRDLHDINMSLTTNQIEENHYDYKLNMNFRTNITNTLNVSLYNYTENAYTHIQTNTTDQWVNLSYSFTNISDFLDQNNRINVSVISNRSFDVFRLFIDYIDVNWTVHNYANFTQSYEAITTTFYIYDKESPSSFTDGLEYRYIYYILFNKTEICDIYLKGTPYMGGWLSTSTIFEYSNFYVANITSLEYQIHSYLGTDYTDPSEEGIGFRLQLILNQNISYTYTYDNFSQHSGWTSRYMNAYTAYEKGTNEEFLYETWHWHYNTHPSLKRMRYLQYVSDYDFQGFLSIPYITDEKGVSDYVPDPEPPEPSEDNPMPERGDSWEYMIFQLAETTPENIYYTEEVDFYNDTVDNTIDQEYTTFEGVATTAYFYYEDETIKRSDLGSWRWEFDFPGDFDFTISFNFMRNAIVFIINALLLILQYIFFLIWMAVAFVFTWLLFVVVVPFFWNTVWFNVWSGLLWFYWYGLGRLIYIVGWIWRFLDFIWVTWLDPFLDWLFNDFYLIAIEFFITVWALIIAGLLWALSLGNADYWEIYDQVHSLLTSISEYFIDGMTDVFNNLPAIVLYIMWYFIMIGMLLEKYILTKSRGFVRRAEQLENCIKVYMIPINLTYEIIIRIKEVFGRWT
ncbi:MAG: hypothetical protein GF311_26640 [Candidatus Lokiarchaeota archaeon]|nr:hypothetical protein [Candidatus Lokiarchaeota archaeon]